MALGGGTFITQNKVLPGAYINFVSKNGASASLSDRGYAAMGFELDWGKDSEVVEITSSDFAKHSMKLFGYDYAHEKLKGLRDLFRNISTLYAYKLNSSGTKASNEYGTAVHAGIRGNDLKIVVQIDPDDVDKKIITLYLGNVELDVQIVGTAGELKDNDYVAYKKDGSLELTAGTPFTGGTNGEVTAADYQTFLDKIEPYSFNAVGVVSDTPEINQLAASFCKRMRDEQGIKFQAVVYNTAADHEGVVNVKNAATDEGWPEASLVYWVTGIIAACKVNKSNLNKKYDGEFQINTEFTQRELEAAIKAGEFTIHQVGSEKRVLSDINSLVTTSDEKGDLFKENQTIRVVDQIANDIAVMFNTRYLGAAPNNESGRISLWSDIVKHHENLQDIGAIEGFSSKDVSVMQGDTKRSVVVSDTVTVVNAMAQLYMSCIIQ